MLFLRNSPGSAKSQISVCPMLFSLFSIWLFPKTGTPNLQVFHGEIMGEMMEFDHFPQLVDPAAPCHVGMDWCHHNWSLVLPEPASSASQCPVEEVVKLYEDALAFNELQEGSWLLHLLFFLCEKPVFFGPRDSFLVLRIFLHMILKKNT